MLCALRSSAESAYVYICVSLLRLRPVKKGCLLFGFQQSRSIFLCVFLGLLLVDR